MPTLNSSQLASGTYADMRASVATVPNNKVLLDNISNVYNFDNIIQLPMSFLRKYENIIKKGLVDYKIDKSRFYRPEYVSYDLYGTTDLWYLILFANDLKSPMELNFEDIKVPSSMYTLEIINKLKSIDRVKSTHKNPKYIYRSLIKDVNFSSDKIDKNIYNNDFIEDINVENNFTNSIDELDDTCFKVSFKRLSRSICNGFESPTNNSLRPSEDIYRGLLSSKNPEKMITNKNLKSNEKYYLLNRFSGELNYLNIINKNNKINKNIIKNKINNFKPIILTYDLREATLAPEYLIEHLVLKMDDVVYEPEIFTDKVTKQQFYGIKIEKNIYEIYYDGTAYYIILNEDNDTRDIALLENKADGSVYHSMNEWIFNDKDTPLIKLDEESDQLYFNEDFSYKYGEYVYTFEIDDLQTKKLNKNNNVKYRININRDLQSNDNRLDKYQFLGFDMNVGYTLTRKSNTYTDEKYKEYASHIKFSPLQITIVSNELDETGKNIEYTFSYPSGIIPEGVRNNNEKSINDKNPTIAFFDYIDNNSKETGLFDMFTYRRIIPICKNLSNPENIDIKEILVSTSFEMDEDYEFPEEESLKISCGSLRLTGYSKEDIVTEFVVPTFNKEIDNFIIDYQYTPDKYRYFELGIFNGNENLMEVLSDEFNNSDYYKNTLLDLDSEDTTIPYNKLNKDYRIDFSSNINFVSNDYISFELYKSENGIPVKKFDLADQYSMEIMLHIPIQVDNKRSTKPNKTNAFKDNISCLNAYDYNNDNDGITYTQPFQRNFHFMFNKNNDNFYMIQLGENAFTTNYSKTKDEGVYENKNKYLKHFMIYDEKDIVSRFKNVYIDPENDITVHNNNIINVKNNGYYSIPEGLFKSITGEGSESYIYYKGVNEHFTRCYPIFKTDVFSKHYFNIIQNPTANSVMGTHVDLTVNDAIYFKIEKFNEHIYIYYKFNEKDNYTILHNFVDFYKPLNNGTIGFNFINSALPLSIKVLSYKTK